MEGSGSSWYARLVEIVGSRPENSESYPAWIRRQPEGSIALALLECGYPSDSTGLTRGLQERWAKRAARGIKLGHSLHTENAVTGLAPAVDLAGYWLRNWAPIGQRAWHKVAFQRGRVFDISVESSYHDKDYVSEKVLDASFGAAIPIYSGGQWPPYPQLLREERMLRLGWGTRGDVRKTSISASSEQADHLQETKLRSALQGLWTDQDGSLQAALRQPVF